MSALLALVSSMLWGGADFVGGRLARGHAAYSVVVRAQVVAAAAMVVAYAVAGDYTPHGPALLWGALAGAAGVVALGAFYHALAIGRMTLVAPIAATSVAVPVLLGLAIGQHPSLGQTVGIVVAAGGTILAVGPELRSSGGGQTARSIVLALVAALGFGLVLVTIALGSRTSVVQTLLSQRLVGVAVLGAAMLFLPRDRRPWSRRENLAVTANGASDLTANLLYAEATRTGILPVTSVLASLYPIVTALLAHWLDGERLRRIQYAGVAAAFVGVALLTAG
ncbi:MAG TPA: DMT family transporter [Pseudonocardiaceae bacterium]|jgi:drug/metabolite transporter (DMT)-like permease|nr:DMT family transporter [Pseudonocardiaceae bacterium]